MKKDIDTLAQLRSKLMASAQSKVIIEREHLSKDDQKRYDKLTAILERLKAGEKVYTSDLKRWLKDDYAKIAEDWEKAKSLMAYFSDIPKDFRLYTELVKQAQFYKNRSDAYGRRGNSQTANRIYYKSERYYELALEELSGLLALDPSLNIYLDRTVLFEAGSDIGTNAIQIPRLITSRSLDRQGDRLKQVSQRKNQVKINVVETVLRGMTESTGPIDE